MSKINLLEVNFSFGGENNTIYPVILEDENEMILIDCGYPNFLKLIEDVAISDEIDIKKLSKIIITHHDFDHMGSLAEFKRKYPSVQVLASKEDEPYINDNKKSLRLQQAESIYNSLTEEEKEQAKNFHKMLESIESCNVDINEAKKSVKKLLNYDINKIICYHGGIYEKDIINALKRI